MRPSSNSQSLDPETQSKQVSLEMLTQFRKAVQVLASEPGVKVKYSQLLEEWSILKRMHSKQVLLFRNLANVLPYRLQFQKTQIE